MKKKILFVNAILENNTPRSIRTLNFIKHLSDEHEIHVLYFKFKKDNLQIPGAIVHTIELNNFFKRKFIASKSKNVFLRLLYKINNLPNKLKDVFYFDIKRLSKKINQLDNKVGFENIIISVFPFSLYKLIDNIAFEKVTYDIGDHLYKNSAVQKFSNDYYYELEKKAILKSRKIIVTNTDTKLFYTDNYNLEPSKIEIISQGFDEEFINNIKGSQKKKEKNFIRLVYGGRFYSGLRDPNPLVKAIQKYNISNPLLKIQFDIYGGHGISINEGNGVTIFPSIDQKSLFKEILNSDYNVFIDNKKGIQTPGKIYENLALGISMLFVKSPNITKTFEYVRNCTNLKFIDNDFNEISKLLLELNKNKDKIIYDFNLSLHSWKNLSLLLIN